MSDEAKPTPAWGYHKKHGAKLFADGKLAPGYEDRPHPGQHPMSDNNPDAEVEVEKLAPEKKPEPEKKGEENI